MSIFIRKHRSKAAKIIGIAFFVLLMFVNIQVNTNPSKSGDIDLFGLKVSLFTPTLYASGGGGWNQYVACGAIDCSYLGNEFCGYADVWNSDGTVTTYWCIIYVVYGDPGGPRT